ncbi:amidohydrolase [Neobacillus sp. D3-1R]|uniref:amidohydrolase n=1 Tax=Neobacillus sp. D3-1R TaxID=3445778 RepID=UPI003FA06399
MKLWFGGSIYTLQNEKHTVEAVLTKDDYIVAIGKKKDLEERYHREIIDRIDLNGATMLPGFVDSHLHLIGYGETLIRLDLSGFTTKKDVLAAVKDYAKSFTEGEWIIGDGWNENLWDDATAITRLELDEIISDSPVILKRICRHALVANSKALELAEITVDTKTPAGGVIEVGSNGELTGLLKDQAQELLLKVVPNVTKQYLEKSMTAAIKGAHQLGLTGGHTEDLNYYSGFHPTYETFEKVIKEKGNKFRAHLLVHHGVVDEMNEAGYSSFTGDTSIEFGAMKIFADGALGGRTALLSFPYADDPTTNGVAIFTKEQLNDLVAKARRLNMPVAIHTIGDLAFDYALSAIEQNPVTKGRDRIIHAQILNKDLIERAKNQSSLILDLQPRFLASDFPWVIERIGSDKMEFCYAWKTLIDAGIPCAGGSDAPIEPLNPLLGIHAAVTRTNHDDPNQTVYGQKEKLTVYEAVSLFTKGSAYAICHEHNRGMIQEGFLADFTILEEDIFTVLQEKIANLKVKMTVIGGDIVYQS